ncbi:MAG: efflux RND transporter periplasmic adaptor subunit [Candidatus Omnitrophota bacterium]|nr:efflux RND transporter periplasmic adaptor subunit [Candidatus Omnitrophota bacterium]
MKRKNIFIIVIGISIAALVLGFILSSQFQAHKGHTLSSQKDIYYCPMHPGYTSDKPGDCAICGMKLVKKEVAQEIEKEMEPGGIQISAERQQFIGVQKETIQKRKLVKEVNTVGRIAYDPELYVAQQEHIEALKAQENTKDSKLALIKEQMKSLAEAAKRKLLLLGMSKAEIEELSLHSKADSSLYLPEEDIVWVYITIYEYEVGLVKVGQIIEIDSVAYPGDVFQGEVVSITPVLDPNTRSINVRAKIKNIENKLKPEMFVNAKIKVEMGEKLAVPEEAVMDTGERRIVFIALADGYFASRKVTLGHKAGRYYEVLDGLDEGDLVVTSGNFFIDSESRLKSAISGEAHKHGQ